LKECFNVDGARHLRVGLLTDHIPVSEVASRLTEDLIIEKIETKKVINSGF
jgi:4-hydroxy-L-threonine phosphate dehydrogenase PdxA